MDLNDLLAEVDGIGQFEQAAAATATRPLLSERSEHTPDGEMSLPLNAPLPIQPTVERITLPTAEPISGPLPAAAREPQRSERIAPHAPQFSSLDLIMDIELEVMVELGQARLPLKKMIAIQPGDNFLLEGRADTPLKIFVNEQLVAYGEPLVVDGSLAIRLVELLPTGTEG